MYKREMQDKFVLLFILIGGLLLSGGGLRAETAVRDSSVISISRDVWYNDFPDAIAASKSIRDTEPDNPLGYFLLGTIYQSLSEEFRTDVYKDRISENLDSAIEIANRRRDKDPDNPNWSFIAGAAHGYRALLRAFHGGWWGAFRDGLNASKHLQRALKLDSTYYDAYLGLGAYDYYKTVKAKSFLWLPFVSDKREEGIEKIKIAIDKGTLASFNARQSLLRIYWEEGRYQDAITLADSLLAQSPTDTYCLLYLIYSQLGLDSLETTSENIKKLRLAWRKSGYYDPLGTMEADYLEAELYYKKGDMDRAKTYIDKIMLKKDFRESNAYFNETVEKTEKLADKIK